MDNTPRQISLEDWDARHAELKRRGIDEPWYGGPLRRHVDDGDYRLLHLRFDNSPAALRLWNFLLTEEERLREAKAAGKKLVGTMKDLGTVPVMAYAAPNVVAFYPDGAWWIPCVMEFSTGMLEIADSLGIDDSFCPVRAMLGAFLTGAHFPIPDLLTCSVGATCDDFSAIAQRLNGLGFPILWWEIPARRSPHVSFRAEREIPPIRMRGSKAAKAEGISRSARNDTVARRHPGEDEAAVELPGGFHAARGQIDYVKSEMSRLKAAIENLSGCALDDAAMAKGIRAANHVRRQLDELRLLAFTSPTCPMPALEMLIAEMFAIHFCSDRDETILVLEDLLVEIRRRVQNGTGYLSKDAARIFWVNPVADLRAMNVLEECGARLCGTEYLFCHALDAIPEDMPPLEALARMALADPMVGPCRDRAERICRDIQRFGAEAVIVSRIPGASHCAYEGEIIRDVVQSSLAIPVAEIEVSPVSDALLPTLRTRIQALVETVKVARRFQRRGSG